MELLRLIVSEGPSFAIGCLISVIVICARVSTIPFLTMLAREIPNKFYRKYRDVKAMQLIYVIANN
jgi:hypothetical protein